MAPERFTSGRVGPQTDVYSLTCVLYECLTGQPPFEADETQQLISAHMFSAPPRPSIMRRGIDRAFDGIIATGMAKQPAARFASAGELVMAARVAAGSGLAPVLGCGAGSGRGAGRAEPAVAHPGIPGELPESGRHRLQPLSACAGAQHVGLGVLAGYRFCWAGSRR